MVTVCSHVGRDLLQNAALFKSERHVVWEYVSNGLQYVTPRTLPCVKVFVEGPKGRRSLGQIARPSRIVVEDNGRGMDLDGLQNFFVMHGENQDRKNGIIGRGRFGTGKSAAFGLANVLTVTSRRNGLRCQVRLTRRAIEQSTGGSIPVEIIERDVHTNEPNGTIIEITSFNIPRINVSGIVDFIIQHLSRWPKGTVFVNDIECIYVEPEIHTSHDFSFPGIKEANLVIKVAKRPLEGDRFGVSIYSKGVWVAQTKGLITNKEMASYLFGEIDVPNLEDESCPISPYDSTRSLALNPNHPLAQKLEAFIGQSLETVRQGLLAEKRKQQEEARHRELENEAKKLTELFNQACADIYIEFDFRQNERLLGKGPILDSDGLDLVGGLGTDGVGSNGSAYTRERVRQIEVRFFEHLLSSFTWFPQWNQFFDFWKDLPVSINVMGAVEPFYQFHKGQWNKGVPLLFLHTVMERMTPELENGRIIVLKDNLQTLTRLEPRMTRVESRHYRELVDEYKEASGVLVSESLSGTGKQLLERKGWRLIDEYYFSKVPQPPWVGALRKILSITENISLSEFRKLAFYDPRITWLPPAKTLIKLVPWLCEFASIDGYNINRATMLNRKEQLGALENAIVDAFESSGKHILSVDQIVEYANRLQQERFETSSVLQYTSRSVILDRIPRTGLRFLVGTQISPTQIEAAKESLKGIGNRRGILGYTWVNRNLLLLYRLGSLPTFYIPKVCSNVLSGTFRIIAPAHGIIKIRNGLAWGASPIIRRFQSSGSRRVMYIFDPDTHEVSMVFGDDSLCIPSM